MVFNEKLETEVYYRVLISLVLYILTIYFILNRLYSVHASCLSKLITYSVTIKHQCIMQPIYYWSGNQILYFFCAVDPKAYCI